jgi:uncharacterized protein (DUF4415 family)
VPVLVGRAEVPCDIQDLADRWLGIIQPRYVEWERARPDSKAVRLIGITDHLLREPIGTEELRSLADQTKRQEPVGTRKKTDEEIREAVESDPDTYFLDEDWFEAATFVNPSAEKERISIRLDEDILEFFRSQGRGYQSRINKVLREYMTVRQYKGEE